MWAGGRGLSPEVITKNYMCIRKECNASCICMRSSAQLSLVQLWCNPTHPACPKLCRTKCPPPRLPDKKPPPQQRHLYPAMPCHASCPPAPTTSAHAVRSPAYLSAGAAAFVIEHPALPRLTFHTYACAPPYPPSRSHCAIPAVACPTLSPPVPPLISRCAICSTSERRYCSVRG